MSEPRPTSRSALVRMMHPTPADREALQQCRIDPAQVADDGFDYSRVVVRKPWGYEYLMFQNDAVAVWILRLLPGASTSLHCHLHKTTSLAVLSGEACCRSVERSVTRKAGEGLVIGPAVFHQTTALSPDGVFLMEIEAPVNKRDLVRLSDAYGRSGLGYESTEHMTVNTANYNRLTFLGDSIFYNTRKRFKDTTVRIVRATGAVALAALTDAESGDLVGVLRGRVLNRSGDVVASAGEFVDLFSGDLVVDADFEAVVVSYRDRRSRLADIAIGHLRNRDAGAFFFSPGTTNAHLVDAVAREGEGAFIPQTSDAAAAHAAVAYAKLTGRPSCCILSAGAAAAAAIPAVAEAWTDSAPVVFLCAQTRLSGFPRRARGLRQLANKELNGVALTRAITKRARVLSDPLSVRVELDDALHLAANGRAGPVWLELPIDLLGALVDEAQMRVRTRRKKVRPPGPTADEIRAVLDLLRRAKRPLLVGHGIRAAHAQSALQQFLHRLMLPVMTTRRGADLVPDGEPLFVGRPGTYGHAHANELLQQCDLLVAIGARLELPLVGRNFPAFAAQAAKVVVDLDRAELTKPTVSPTLAIRSDAGAFLDALLAAFAGEAFLTDAAWNVHCRERNPARPNGAEHLPGVGLDAFAATATLARVAPPDAVIIAEGGSPLDYVMRTWGFRGEQRLLSAPALEGDGFSLAGAVGASLALPRRRILCLCEAGSFLRSTPELATLLHHRLPVTVVVFCAADDHRVRTTQDRYFGERNVTAAPQHELAAAVASLSLAKLGTAVLHDSATEAPEAMFAQACSASGPSICLIRVADEAHRAAGPKYHIHSDGRWEVAEHRPSTPASRSPLTQQ